jgi:hypothetical protein
MFNIDDLPAAEPLFDYDRLGLSLAALLNRPHPAAFVLGLHGPWGAGKTTLLNAIRRNLFSPAVTVEFNAWKYQNREALWRALILRVLASLRDAGGDATKIERLERSLYESFAYTERGPLHVNWTAAITEALQLTLSLAAVGIGGGFLAAVAHNIRHWFGQEEADKGKGEDTAKRIERVAGIMQRETTERAVRHVVSIEQFVDLFREVAAQLGEARHIFVLIDDLDRCLPESALEVFEAVKLFLDAPECSYVVAVDRSVIRRGLELRYPSRSDASKLAPPVVDPDEYIEKTITLSVDLPTLTERDAKRLLDAAGMPVPLSDTQSEGVIDVLGTNPRRLKRFAAMLSLWFTVAEDLRNQGRVLTFSPLDAANLDLFIKLGLIGYLNSAVIAQMLRDPALPQRLQSVSNSAFAANAPKPWQEIVAAEMTKELPIIAQAALDPALWRALRLRPLLTTAPNLPAALRWFRTAGGAG